MSERFIGRVVNVDDPERAGRVQIRIYGIHDDHNRIPDSALPWARPIFPITNPINQGVAGPTTGLVVGSTVVGHFADNTHQIPLIDGTMGAVTEDGNTDFPQADRGEDFNRVLGASLPGMRLDELRSIGRATIANIDFVGQSIHDLIADIGEGDVSGAMDALREGLRAFNEVKHLITVSAVNEIATIVSGFSNEFSSIIEEAEDVVNTAEGVVVQAANIPGTVGGTDLLTQINSATGVVFNTPNHMVGSIATRISKRTISSPADAINRMSGHRFVMSHTMRNIDQTISRLSSVAHRGRSLVNDIQQAGATVQQTASEVNSLVSRIG